MLIYVAHPIDRANQSNRTKISGALAALGGGRAHLNGNHMYIPSAAFKLGPGVKPDATINTINGAALEQSQAMLALWPRDAKSWGVPIEVDRMVEAFGRRVALVVEEDPTWAMIYGENLQTFKVDPREFDGFTMATLRALDWLTGHERTERKLTHPSSFKNEINLDRAGVDALAGAVSNSVNDIAHQVARVQAAIHAETLASAVSDGATEGLTQGPTAEEAQTGCECAEDPKEGPGDSIGFRNVGKFNEDYVCKLPTRGYTSDAGLDIYVSEDTTVEPHTFADVRSHTAVNLPPGHWGYLVGRSSTLRKKGLLVNPGVIDNGYTGELYSAVWNLTSQPVKIHAGERVAQLILMPNITPGFHPEWVNSVTESDRGDKGFGSSGV